MHNFILNWILRVCVLYLSRLVISCPWLHKHNYRGKEHKEREREFAWKEFLLGGKPKNYKEKHYFFHSTLHVCREILRHVTNGI